MPKHLVTFEDGPKSSKFIISKLEKPIHYKCVQGHDLCNQSYPDKDCPYCEKRKEVDIHFCINGQGFWLYPNEVELLIQVLNDNKRR